MTLPVRTVSRLALVLGLLAVVLASGGCSKKAPTEANASLDAALKALAKGDAKAFADQVLPAQQEGVTSLLEWASFFRLVKSHEIDNEFDRNVTEDSATISTKLLFDEAKEAYSNIAFTMKKVEEKWYIDLTETIKAEREANTTNAFQIWKMEVKPAP